MSWADYMSEEGWRFYGFDQLALLSLSPEIRVEARHRIEMCGGPAEMWEIINGLKCWQMD